MSQLLFNGHTYSFDKTYYENFYDNLLTNMNKHGNTSNVIDIWDRHELGASLDGITVSHGVDIRGYVQATYNGDMPHCMSDKLMETMANAYEDIGFILGGPIGAKLGREIARVINQVLAEFLDLLGSFVCTATGESLKTECYSSFLTALKGYRIGRFDSDAEGLQMVKYYYIIGPRIVEAIEADPDKPIVYQYLWSTYIHKLKRMVDNDDRVAVLHTYLLLLDDMTRKYDIKTTAKFARWLKHSIEGN